MMVRRRDSKPLRVLLSEGSSTSAREAVTLLGRAGHHVEVCDPAPWGLARFSRHVRAWHRCPGLRGDPQGYLAAVERLFDRNFDVLLPIHEQGYLFARVQHRFGGRTSVALPSFTHYRSAVSKTGFSRVLAELGLPQPTSTVVNSADEARRVAIPPSVIKTAIGTASRGVWIVRDSAALARALSELYAADGFSGGVLVQALIQGFTEKAQGVFCRGELVGFHATRQMAEGAGGGDAIKRSVRRDGIRRDLAAIGRHLDWHGALSVDCIMPDDGSGPFYIDCNPRLVEPMAAALAGTDLIDLLLRVSLGETPAAVPDGRADVVTHQAMQVLLGCAQRGGSRRDLARLCSDLAWGRGAFAGSVEELTPARLDMPGAIPLAITALLLLVSPKLADGLSRRGWGAHLLDRRSIALIELID
jgi:hypothetical protein